jgi:hypothetical protein
MKARVRLALWLHRQGARLARRLVRASPARLWSNHELSRLGPQFRGDVVNVSAWRDEDKQGRRYRDYFPNARSYAVTNYSSPRKGLDHTDLPSIPLDLTAPVPPDLRERFDVVLSHTTLEHVFDVQTAAGTLAALTRDVLIVVVPLKQPVHGLDEGEGDFWRFTPMALDRLFAPHGLRPVYAATNEQPWWDVYVVWVGSRRPERWARLQPLDRSA